MELMIDVVGFKCFKGTIDGKQLDGGSLFGLIRMDESYNKTGEGSINWKGGHTIEEWKLPSSEMVMRMAHLKPNIKNPVAVRLQVERVSNGTDSREIVLDATPVNGTIVDQQTGEVKQVMAVKKAA